MIEHIDRFPWVRDRAIFVGHEPDIVPDTFGATLPAIRDWTTQHYSYSGYITGFTPPNPDELPAIRAQLGYRDDELVCVVAVGGSVVGQALIGKLIAAYPLAKKAVPELRMVVVTGPRIDPAQFPQYAGLELHGYVHRLYAHPMRMRPGRRTRWPVHDDGVDRGQAPVPLLPARPSLRAELSCTPPTGSLSGG